MNVALYVWIGIAILGVVVYATWPALIARRMYEGFEDASTTAPATTTAPTAAPTAPPAAPTAPTAPTAAPTAAPTTAPAAPAATTEQMHELIDVLNTLLESKKQEQKKTLPTESDSIQSSPAKSTEQSDSKESLAQGAVFSAGCPKPPAAEPLCGAAAAPVKPCLRCPYCKRRNCACPSAAAPKPTPNAVCPDMRDYVRKDSIPCWGCKLK